MHKLLQDWGTLQHTLYKGFGNDGQCIIFRLVPVWCLYIQIFFMKLEWFKIWYEIEWQGEMASLLSCLFGAKENWPETLYMPHLFCNNVQKKPIHVIYREHNHENAPSMSSIDRFNQVKLSDSNAIHNHNKTSTSWLIPNTDIQLNFIQITAPVYFSATHFLP